MAVPTDRVQFQNLTVASTSTDFTNVDNITILNNGTNPISILNSSDSFTNEIKLANGEAVVINSESGFELPTIRITTSTGTCQVSIIWD